MKKLVLVLAIALIAVPAFAAVTLTGTPSGTTVTVGYDSTGGALPRAFGLVLEATGGTITSVSATKTGESTSGALGYGIFPGTIDINDVTGAVASYGSPVEPNALPGGPSAIGSSRVVVALGSLYGPGDANKPGATGTLFTVVCSAGTTSLTVSEEETYRGGIVDVNAVGLDIASAPKVYTFAAPECFPGGPTGAKYLEWVAVGKPECWCASVNPRQCRGDADGMPEGKGKVWVYSNDLTILQTAWNKNYATIAGQTYYGNGVTTEWICADFSHSPEGKGNVRVYSGDLTILQSNWNSAATPADCADSGY